MMEIICLNALYKFSIAAFFICTFLYVENSRIDILTLDRISR